MVGNIRRKLEINNYNFNCKRQNFSRNGHMQLQTLQSPWTSDKIQPIAKKTPRGMYTHPCNHISLAATRIFHPFTSPKTI